MRLSPALLAGLAATSVLAAGPAQAGDKPVVPLPSTPDLGKAEAHCRAGEQGPALLISVVGLKDRAGRLKLEVYPSNDEDFLMDDNVLVYQHKAFRRVEEEVPASGAVQLCARIPGPGAYSVMLLHDRDSNRKFGWMIDGIGFSANPRLGWHKPKAAATRVMAGTGLTRINIVLNYRHGLGMSPMRDGD
ncbi:MAG TPA: DUF2141 domain-containing protein [Novosphingobium sp.]|nr:DUF2141 domain-containing protein [Novosphingobium sp.]